MNIHWKDWCWSLSSSTLATWCEELTHWKIPWCWERLKAGGEGDNRDGLRRCYAKWNKSDRKTNTISFYLLFLLFSHYVMYDSLWPCGLQHTRLPCPSPTHGSSSNSCPLSWWCHQPPHPLSSPSPSAFNLSQHQGLFQWVSSSPRVAKVLEL